MLFPSLLQSKSFWKIRFGKLKLPLLGKKTSHSCLAFKWHT
jgi:hypothetical protein